MGSEEVRTTWGLPWALEVCCLVLEEPRGISSAAVVAAKLRIDDVVHLDVDVDAMVQVAVVLAVVT